MSGSRRKIKCLYFSSISAELKWMFSDGPEVVLTVRTSWYRIISGGSALLLRAIVGRFRYTSTLTA
jgi:hypothetical protein